MIRGVIPRASAKIITTTRLRRKLKYAVRTTESGMTIRGKWIFRTRFSRSTSEPTDPIVASAKNVKITMS